MKKLHNKVILKKLNEMVLIMKKKIKWTWIICFSLLIIIFLFFLFRITILTQAGQFMAPQGSYTADAVILEGSEFITRSTVINGIKLLSSGKVKKIIVVLHRIAPLERPFSLNEDYPDRVKKKLKAYGLKENNFTIIVTHIQNPITLTEAREVLEVISKMSIKSAILMSQGFHTRRSYLIYQQLCTPHQIKIFPSAYFNSYQLEHWWTQGSGRRDFITESLKLVYYIGAGHISFKFLLNNKKDFPQ